MALVNNTSNDVIKSYLGELSVGESAAGITVYSSVEPGYKLLFNPLTTLTSVSAAATMAGVSATMIGLTATLVGVDLSVSMDTAYNGREFSVIGPDRTSTYGFYLSATTIQTVTANGFGAVSPTLRRLVALGYL